MTDNNDRDKDEEIIELSDISVGTSQEDEKIIELTEDLVDEARDAISGITPETDEESRPIELTEEQAVSHKSSEIGPEEKIESELDNYFSTKEESTNDFIELDQPVAEPVDSREVSISDQQLEAALERVVERKYRERIESLIDEMIRRKVSEDIETLKEFILNRSAGK